MFCENWTTSGDILNFDFYIFIFHVHKISELIVPYNLKLFGYL